MELKNNRFYKLSRKAFREMSYLSTIFFKFGSSLVLMALAAIYILCERDVTAGSVGVELYYGPMVEYILMAFLIFWVGTFILDLAEKEYLTKK